MEHREPLSGFVRLHILLHAADEPVYGAWITEEPPHHGYRRNAGTLCPLLHGMEKKGCPTNREERRGKTIRQLYAAMDLGREALGIADARARDLLGALVEGHGVERRPSATTETTR